MPNAILPPSDPGSPQEPTDGTAKKVAVLVKQHSAAFNALVKWGKILGALAGIGSAVAGVWSMVDAVDDLHDTILQNKQTVHDVASAVRVMHEADQRIITDLRIAIAAIQAAENVRAGRGGYAGVDALHSLSAPASVNILPVGPFGTHSMSVDAVPPLLPAELAVAPMPTSDEERTEQATHASSDASRAIQRASVAQMQAESEDPLAEIGF